MAKKRGWNVCRACGYEIQNTLMEMVLNFLEEIDGYKCILE